MTRKKEVKIHQRELYATGLRRNAIAMRGGVTNAGERARGGRVHRYECGREYRRGGGGDEKMREGDNKYRDYRGMLGDKGMQRVQVQIQD